MPVLNPESVMHVIKLSVSKINGGCIHPNPLHD